MYSATNSPELQRLTEEVAEVKESIKELRNILLSFKDELKQEVKQTVQNEVASLINNTIASLIYKDDDEILTCSKLSVYYIVLKYMYLSARSVNYRMERSVQVCSRRTSAYVYSCPHLICTFLVLQTCSH